VPVRVYPHALIRNPILRGSILTDLAGIRAIVCAVVILRVGVYQKVVGLAYRWVRNLKHLNLSGVYYVLGMSNIDYFFSGGM